MATIIHSFLVSYEIMSFSGILAIGSMFPDMPISNPTLSMVGLYMRRTTLQAQRAVAMRQNLLEMYLGHREQAQPPVPVKLHERLW